MIDYEKHETGKSYLFYLKVDLWKKLKSLKVNKRFTIPNLDEVVGMPNWGIFLKINKILVNQSMFRKLLEQIISSYPYEFCSILIGEVRGDEYQIWSSVKTENLFKSQTKFGFLSHELHEAIKSNKNKQVSIFHSHLKGLYPSRQDTRQIKDLKVPWLIGTLFKRKKDSIPRLRIRAYIYQLNKIDTILI